MYSATPGPAGRVHLGSAPGSHGLARSQQRRQLRAEQVSVLAKEISMLSSSSCRGARGGGGDSQAIGVEVKGLSTGLKS
jgi:hypothetical protein